MIQIFQYPHETLMTKSTEWNKDDSIEGYTDLEKFENDYIKGRYGAIPYIGDLTTLINSNGENREKS